MNRWIFLVGLIAVTALYVAVRFAAWSDMVAVPYMSAQYETVRCNKYIAAHNTQRLAIGMGVMDKMVQKDAVPAICTIDEAGCDKAEKMWSEYQESREQYLRHNWIPFFKHLFRIEKHWVDKYK